MKLSLPVIGRILIVLGLLTPFNSTLGMTFSALGLSFVLSGRRQKEQ